MRGRVGTRVVMEHAACSAERKVFKAICHFWENELSSVKCSKPASNNPLFAWKIESFDVHEFPVKIVIFSKVRFR